MRNPMTGWMLPPEPEPGEFEQRWNVAPDRQMPLAEMFARGGMPGMEQYGEADAPAVFAAADKARHEDERRAKILGSLMPGQTRAEADRPGPHSGARDRAMMELGRDLLVPQTPLDAGLMVAGGPVGGKLARGGAAALGALFEPDEAEAVFAGRGAKTADLKKLAAAERLAAKNVYPEEIWTSTGWFKGKDDKWRFEIPDAPSKWNVDPRSFGPDTKRMGEAFSHPELMKAYPELYNLDLDVRLGGGLHHSDVRGSYHAGAPSFGLPSSVTLAPGKPDAMRSVNLHELQHAIQDIEGFAMGGNPYSGLRPGTPAWDIYQERLKAIRTPTPKAELEKAGVLGPEYSYEDYLREHKQTLRNDNLGLDRIAQEHAVNEAYRRSAGEVEARTVQKRADYTPGELQDISPMWSEPVSRDQQIVKFREAIGALATQDRYQQ